MWHKLWQNKLSFLIILLAISCRLYAISQPAQPYDIGTYQAWGNLLLAKGPAEFFASTWCDYLPLPVYLFSFVSWLSSLLHVSFPLVFKFFFSLLELGLLAWLFRLTKSFFHPSRRSFLLLSFVFLLSPALIGDTSWWGQTDSLPALLALISLLYFQRFLVSPLAIGHWPFVILIALAISIKPIMILTLPAFAILFVLPPFNLKSRILHLLPATLVALAIFIAPALPLDSNPVGAFRFLLDKTLEQASTYPFTSINAFNFWTLSSSFSSWPPDNQIVLGVSARTFGQFLFSLLSLITLNYWRKQKFSPNYAPRIAATLLITFFTFTTRMHERHLLYGLPFLALAALEQPWLLFSYVLYTISFTLNLWAAYSWVIHNQTWPMPILWAQLASWATTLTTLLLVFVWDWPRFYRRLRERLLSHRVLVCALLLASCLRFFNLAYPPTHIFDEVYHAFTAEELVKNNLEAWEWWTTPPAGFAYEWTHPPVAKYGMVAGLLLFGDGSFGWRSFSAIFGVFCILGVYRLTLALLRRRRVALLAAFLLSIEGLHLVQSRIGMNDIYLLTLLIWSLYYALLGRWKNAAVLYGLALASKWSALYGLLPLALIYLNQYFPQPFRLSSFVFRLINAIRFLFISALTYLLTYTPFIASGHSFTQLLELHRQMWYYHTGLVATHTYQSVPWQWLLSLRPVWYWVDYGDLTANIYAQANPLILWLGLVALILSLPRIRRFPYLLLVTCYTIFTIPWLFSPRIMFFYHYLPSVTFLIILLADWLSSLSQKSIILILLLSSFVFCLLSPMYYGFPMPSAYWDTLFSVFPSWK